MAFDRARLCPNAGAALLCQLIVTNRLMINDDIIADK